METPIETEKLKEGHINKGFDSLQNFMTQPELTNTYTYPSLQFADILRPKQTHS